jgi:glycerol uptake facilitator protein
MVCQNDAKSFIGEFIGTFILVFFGCSSVGVAVIFGSFSGLFQVAMIWGLGVTVAIYTTRHLSCAHLNPAVSLAMVIGKRMTLSKMAVYWVAQFLGAFIAASLIYLIFNNVISQFEIANGIIRGAKESVITAQMFGEFFPNPGVQKAFTLSSANAFFVEAIGTFVLVFIIFSLTEDCNVGKPDSNLAPFFIGMTVTALIGITAPFTQTGLNPARDFSPRLFSYFAGWKSAAMPDGGLGFLWVYILGPMVGATVASIVFCYIVEPIMKLKKEKSSLDSKPVLQNQNAM